MNMYSNLSISNLKLINKLKDSKYRYEYKLFWVEGLRSISSFIEHGLELKFAVISCDFSVPEDFIKIKDKIFVCKNDEIKKIKATETFPGIGAVFAMPSFEKKLSDTIIILEKISDPGNLGTIFRTAAWFGIDTFILDSETVDPYNEKTIRASMGALGIIKFHFAKDLKSELQNLKAQGFSIISTCMDGTNIKETSFPKKRAIVFGKESSGISKQILDIS
ncbi:MAG: hypothetical protein ACD_79C01276G0001, partial [uncultured bacterium]